MNARKLMYFSLIILSCLAGACNNKKQTNTENQATTGEEDNTGENNQTEGSRENNEAHPGASVYTQNCSVCHQTDGSGVPGLYPPLIDTEWINGDETRLISVVLNGLSGPIEVKGENYNNVMPQFSYLDDQEIADLLTYLRQSFDNNSGEITVEAVADVRASQAE